MTEEIDGEPTGSAMDLDTAPHHEQIDHRDRRSAVEVHHRLKRWLAAAEGWMGKHKKI